MGKKYTILDLKRIAGDRNGTCLSVEYLNIKTKYEWKCAEGHTWIARFDHVKNGSWCPECHKKRAGETLKLTIEEMKDLAKARGGSCLSSKYTNTKNKLTWRCSNGHVWKATPSHIKEGSWCPECATYINSQKLKHNIEKLKKIAEERGGKCLSESYINGHQKLIWQCKLGHQWEASTASVKSGSWCPKCSALKAGDSQRLSLKDMVKIAKERNGKCISKTYVNTKTKLKWQCYDKHEWEATPSSIFKGSWCPFCAGTNKKTLEELKKNAQERGGRCLSQVYSNVHTRLKWQCDKGHVWDATPSSIIRGSWCRKCKGLSKKTIKEMQAVAIERGGECLSTSYDSVDSPLTWKCANGHTWRATYSSIKAGSWCPRCSGRINEEKCRFIIERLTGYKFNKTRTILSGRKELDGYNEELRVAFEYQGEQHYNFTKLFHPTEEDFIKQKIRDEEKKAECIENNIYLIEIPFTEATDDAKVQYIKSKLKAKDIKIVTKKLGFENFYKFNSQLNQLKNLAAGHQGKCLSQEYINAHTKLKWECKLGHQWEAVPSSIQQGTWCPKCAIKSSGNSQRLSIEEMQEIAVSRGGKCLSEHYINAKTKLLWECSQGHQWEAVPSSVKKGTWCNICSTKRATTKLSDSLEKMQEVAVSRGGRCLSKEYKGSFTPLEWQCNQGHIWKAVPSSVKKGTWCPQCSGTKKKTIEDMHKLAQLNAGKCVSDKYINSKTPLRWECKNGHRFERTGSHVKEGRWCPFC